MKQKTDTIFYAFLIIIISFIIGKVGYEISERNHCVRDGGNYSYDYGICFEKGVVK